MNSASRANGLDGLRGLAAAAVVLLHVWMFSGANQPWHAERLDQAIGAMGVALMLFFVLSGMLIATPWIRAAAPGRRPPSLRRYALRRAARIVPGYALCVLGSYWLMHAIEHPLAVPASELPAFLLFAQNQMASTAGHLNPPLWSLSVEVAFYVVMPLIGLLLIALLRRSGTRGALVGGALLIAAGLAWGASTMAAGEPDTRVASLPTYLPIFACGIAAAAIGKRHEFGRAARGALAVAGAALVGLNGWWHADGTEWLGHVVRDLPAGVGFAMIVLAVAQGPARILGTAPLRRLGDYSFGIYLWHMPVLYALRHWERWPDSPWDAFGVVFGVATVLGAASFHLVEQPWVRWAARRTASPAPAPDDAHLPVPEAMAGAHGRLHAHGHRRHRQPRHAVALRRPPAQATASADHRAASTAATHGSAPVVVVRPLVATADA